MIMKSLKKFTVVAIMLVMSIGASAQKGDFSLNGKLGYQTEFERFGVEVGGRYEFVTNFRIAPAVSFWFPKDDILGFNIDLNAQYKFTIPQTTLDIYPLAGLNVSNNRCGGKFEGVKISDSVGSTKFGVNLGFGADYYFTNSDYLNFEFKYAFSKVDFATIMIGYGYKF